MKLLQSFSVVPSIIYNSLPTVWKASRRIPVAFPVLSMFLTDRPTARRISGIVWNKLFSFFLSFFFLSFSFFRFSFCHSFFLSVLITLPQSGTCNRLWTRTLEFRAVPQSRLTTSLHNECALRRMDEYIYSEVGQTHRNTW